MDGRALGIAAESPQRARFFRAREDLQRKARPPIFLRGERPKNYSNRMAFTGEIFVMMYEGTKSMSKHNTKVPIFKAMIYPKLI